MTRTAAPTQSSEVERFFEAFPSCRLVTPADEPALARFHRSLSMKAGPVSLAYDFGATTAPAAAEAGHASFVTVFEEQGRIAGTASVVSRRMQLQGDSVPYGYLANLRIAPTMSASLKREWRRLYGAMVAGASSSRALGQPAFLLTAVLNDNVAAVKFLTQRLREVHYVPVQQYTTLTTLGPLPWARRTVSGVRLRLASELDRSRIERFLLEQVARRGMGEDYASELPRRRRDWANFRMSHFVIAEDREKNIIAVVAPYSSAARTLMVTDVPSWLRPVARFFARAQGRELSLPGPLRVLHLTHLTVDSRLSLRRRRAIVEALAWTAWSTAGVELKCHAMSVTAWPQFGDVSELRGWAHVARKGTLYQVVRPGEAPHRALLEAAQRAPIPFEGAVS